MLRGLRRLEERVVLDASAAPESGETDDGPGADRMVVINGNAERADLLAAAARDGVTVVTYDSGRDGLAALLDKIRGAGEGMDALSSIAFVGAGDGGELRFTVDSLLNAAELSDNPELAAFWSEVAGLLTEDGRIDLLAGDLFRGDEGRALLNALEALTGVSFSAPTEESGGAATAIGQLTEADDVNLDGGYFDGDFLASFAFLADLSYIGNSYFALPDGSELELREGETLFDWNQILVAGGWTGMVVDCVTIIITLNSPDGADISDALDTSRFPFLGFPFDVPISEWSSMRVDALTDSLINLHFHGGQSSESLRTAMIPVLNQLVLKNPSAWNGATLSVTVSNDYYHDTVAGSYTLTMIDDGDKSSAPTPPAPPIVEPSPPPAVLPDDPTPPPVDSPSLSEASPEGDDAAGVVNRMAELEREYLAASSSLYEFLLEQTELSEIGFSEVSDIVVEMRDVQIALGDLNRGLSLLLHEFARSDPQVGEALRGVIGELAASAQAQISAANRLMGMAADAAHEWNALPAEQRDGSLRERLDAFARTLLETNARVAAAVSGLNAACERIADAEAAAIPDPSEILAGVAAVVERSYARIHSELERRDSMFYELEALNIRRGRIASAADAGGQ